VACLCSAYTLRDVLCLIGASRQLSSGLSRSLIIDYVLPMILIVSASLVPSR
jgi:hypothetical protein